MSTRIRLGISGSVALSRPKQLLKRSTGSAAGGEASPRCCTRHYISDVRSEAFSRKGGCRCAVTILPSNQGARKSKFSGNADVAPGCGIRVPRTCGRQLLLWLAQLTPSCFADWRFSLPHAGLPRTSTGGPNRRCVSVVTFCRNDAKSSPATPEPAFLNSSFVGRTCTIHSSISLASSSLTGGRAKVHSRPRP